MKEMLSSHLVSVYGVADQESPFQLLTGYSRTISFGPLQIWPLPYIFGTDIQG